MANSAAAKLTLLAEQERARILRRDILGGHPVHLGPLAAEQASREVTEFAAALWNVPKMRGYFDPHHFSNMRHHLHEAQHGFASLDHGGIAEIIVIPVMPGNVMGFHLFSVFDPNDSDDQGERIGYGVYSLERGRAGFGRADAVRLAFDIFPAYRENRFQRIRFTNHEIYNISRRMLFNLRPKRFLVDARTQIKETRTGRAPKRALYYLKRGYYPTDQKLLADRLLARMVCGERVTERSANLIIRRSKTPFWVYPVAQYIKEYRMTEPICPDE
ncbi:MAG: hypothetical protein MUF81_05210 [Verrucomicrobia bacterium]|jgi:hypothetical protein|nr:hypothetical protein [Verrucomicrobiota bacterium]